MMPHDTNKGNKTYVRPEELPYEIRMAINTTECPKCQRLLSLKGIEFAYCLTNCEAIVLSVQCTCGRWSNEWVCRRKFEQAG